MRNGSRRGELTPMRPPRGIGLALTVFTSAILWAVFLLLVLTT